MRIVFDHQAFSLQNSGGITRYFYELISHLSSTPDLQTEVLLGFSSTIWPIRETAALTGKVIHWGARPINSGMANYALNELLLNAVTLASSKRDIYHNTLYRFMPAVRARRYVATHHDCIQERFPELFPDHARIIRAKRRMFQKADLILCISESSRADLQYFYEVEPERCRVIYNGVSPMFRSESGKKQLALCTRRPFLLYVGMRAAYKNLNGLLSAFAEARLQASYDLLIVGGGPLSKKESQTARNLGLEKALVSVPLASPEFLAEAYHEAALFVYPSLYEGFGLPPLEAMLAGTPALVAANPATLEICGNAVVFFDPKNPRDFAAKLVLALLDRPTRKANVERGAELVQKYQWSSTAKQVLMAYRSLF